MSDSSVATIDYRPTNGYALLKIKHAKLFPEPYDAINEQTGGDTLCFIENGKIIQKYPTMLISANWALVCARHVLDIFEQARPTDLRPRKALDLLEKWISAEEHNDFEEAAVLSFDASTLVDGAVDAMRDSTINGEQTLVSRVASSAAKACHIAYISNDAIYEDTYYNHLNFIDLTDAPDQALLAKGPENSPEYLKEREWQRKALNDIII